MIKAYVLVVANPGETKRVVSALKTIPGVKELHEVMGPYDVVIELEVESLSDVPPILSDKHPIRGRHREHDVTGDVPGALTLRRGALPSLHAGLTGRLRRCCRRLPACAPMTPSCRRP